MARRFFSGFRSQARIHGDGESRRLPASGHLSVMPAVKSTHQEPLRSCPICDGRNAQFFIEVCSVRIDRTTPTPSGKHIYWCCSTCKTVFLGQLVPAESLKVYYESPSYHFPASREPSKGPRRISIVRRLQLRLARPLPSAKPGKHLDYGCGTGDYMDFARLHGWECTGIEYTDGSALSARQRGFQVVLNSALDSLPDNGFDYISAIHTLEHAVDPRETFLKLARKLAPGGTMLLELPYLQCLEFRLFGKDFSMLQAPLHLQFLDEATWDSLAESGGVRMTGCRNNLWTPVFFVWSFLNALESKLRVQMSRRLKNQLNALAFPLLLPVAGVCSLLGMKTSVRQYYFCKPN
jgi:SAM-dependent methyltransferase